jgi:hypothetical protein
VWGWDADGQLCAYKDDQQQPIPLDRVYNPLPWKFAQACSVRNCVLTPVWHVPCSC